MSHCTEEGRAIAQRLICWADPIERAVSEIEEPRQWELLGRLTHLLRHEVEENGFVPAERMCASCRYFEPRSWDECDYYCVALERELRPDMLRTDCMLHQPV